MEVDIASATSESRPSSTAPNGGIVARTDMGSWSRAGSTVVVEEGRNVEGEWGMSGGKVRYLRYHVVLNRQEFEWNEFRVPNFKALRQATSTHPYFTPPRKGQSGAASEESPDQTKSSSLFCSHEAIDQVPPPAPPRRYPHHGEQCPHLSACP